MTVVTQNGTKWNITIADKVAMENAKNSIGEVSLKKEVYTKLKEIHHLWDTKRSRADKIRGFMCVNYGVLVTKQQTLR